MEFKLEEIEQEKKFVPMKLEIEIRTEDELKNLSQLFGERGDIAGISTYNIYDALSDKVEELELDD